MNTPTHTAKATLSATDQCVQCGLCSSHCPTYQKNAIEAESPRGRLAIIGRYSDSNNRPSQTSLDHIGHCTGCNRCQEVCPSNVPFEQIIDQFKARHGKSIPLQLKLLLHISRKAGGLNTLKPLLALYKLTGLPFLLNIFLRPGSLYRPHRLLSFVSRTKALMPDSRQSSSETALFVGCSGHLYDQQTLNDCSRVLDHLSISFSIPDKQYCCGALHQHNGQPHVAQQLQQNNIRYFRQRKIKQLVFSASGCGRQLKTYDTDIQFTDIMSFIFPYLDKLHFRPFPETVFVHHSCSNPSGTDSSLSTLKLLNRIPGITLETLAPESCCGAGGSNQLVYPELARTLIADKIQQLKLANSRYLLSDNIGCSLHFKQQLADQGIQVEVIHPISLIARQLHRA